MYYRGSLAEFNEWHEPIKIERGIPSQDGQTIGHSRAIPHPQNSNDFIWIFGEYKDAQKTVYSETEIKNLGFLPNILY